MNQHSLVAVVWSSGIM